MMSLATFKRNNKVIIKSGLKEIATISHWSVYELCPTLLRTISRQIHGGSYRRNTVISIGYNIFI